MLSLFSEVKFWTSAPNVVSIQPSDFGAFRYHKKRETVQSSTPATSDHLAGKRDYAETRGQMWQLGNKGPQKLRNSLERLEEALKNHQIVHCKWQDHAVVQLLLSNGLLVHICINQMTGDIQRLAFDKFFVGKLPAETITDAVFTRMHILIAYTLNQVTFVHLQKPSMRRSAPEKVSRMDPKMFNVIINGPPNRSLARHLACNGSGDLMTVWTKSSQNEVYPWRPTVRDQDRANVNIYRICRAKLEPICYYWTENDPICIEFSAINQNQLHSVEQNVTRKGGVTADICVYEIRKAKLHRISVTAIPLQTQVCCHSFSPDNEKLLLGCIDGSIVVFDEGRGITHLVRSAFIPTMVSWHADSAIVMVANDRCQLQCFDISLACIKNQLLSEDQTPSSVLDLSSYFVTQPNLTHMTWNKKPDLALHAETFTHSDGFLLLLFRGGPATCLRFFGNVGLKGDVHTSGLTADILVHKYLHVNQVERAINVLLCMNWDTYGQSCMVALHKIANYIFRLPLAPEREIQLQKALGSFHVPVKPLCDETEADYGDQVRDITRKFFQYLLRFRSFEKAFSLAIDINDEDLFMDLHNCAKSEGQLELATDAFKKAEEILTENQDEVNSDCSRTSCSECEHESSPEPPASPQSNDPVNHKSLAHNTLSNRADTSNKPRSDYPPLPVFNYPRPKKSWAQEITNAPYVPPLPFSNGSGPENIRVNLPKLELKVSAYSKKHQDRPDPTGRHRMFPSSTYSSANLTSDNILLVDPPLPSIIRKTTSQDNLINMDIHAPSSHRLYHNSYSTDNLNYLGSGGQSYINMDNIPRALPRIPINPSTVPVHQLAQPQKHMVIEVVPKPSTHIQPIVPATWKVPDQTIGIPLTPHTSSHMGSYHQPQYVHRPPAFAIPSDPTLASLYAMKAPNKHNLNVPIIHQHPITQANIPATSSSSSNLPYAPTNSPATNNHHFTIPRSTTDHPNTTKRHPATSTTPTTMNSILSAQPSPKREANGEKNKVKFSDTITVAVVPEIVRKDKPSSGGKRNANGFHHHHHPGSRLTDPQRELADSLPLCHPNDDYLKDFTPVSSEENGNGGATSAMMASSSSSTLAENGDRNGNNNGSGGAIKVVHFGLI